MSRLIASGFAVAIGIIAAGCRTDEFSFEDDVAANTDSAGAADRLAAYRQQFRVQVPAHPLPELAEGNDERTSFEPLAPAYEVNWLQDGAVLRPSFPQEAVSPRRVEVDVPMRLDRAFRLRDVDSGVAISSELVGAKAVAGAIADGHVIYEGAVDGATVIHRPTPSGLEDFVAFESRPASERVGYRVRLEGTTAGVRHIENTLEFLDRDGTPRLRVAPPYVIDGAGRLVWVTLRVSGCEADRSPLGPWGRPVVDPGGAVCDIEVDWSGFDLSYPVLVDPGWATTTNLASARSYHTSAVLGTGKVLVAGGIGAGGAPLATAELFDPATNTWAAASPMADSRAYHGGGTFGNGALVAGGIGSCGAACSAAEQYSIITGLWGSAGSMGTARIFPSYSTLQAGLFPLALLTGGVDASSNALATGDTYTSGAWAPVANSMSSARFLHTSTTVIGSNVAIIANGSAGAGPLTTVDKYTPPPTNSFAPAATGALGRYAHTATQITGTDQVLFVGGVIVTGNCTRITQIYDVSSNVWDPGGAPGSIPSPNRCFHMAEAVAGKVLVAAGRTTPSSAPTNAQSYYTPGAPGSWSTPSPGLTNARIAGSAIRYPTSTVEKVLLTGGENPVGTPIVSTEIFTP